MTLVSLLAFFGYFTGRSVGDAASSALTWQTDLGDTGLTHAATGKPRSLPSADPEIHFVYIPYYLVRARVPAASTTGTNVPTAALSHV
ncbi:hypothetical protein ACKU5V_027440 [Klebsiella pneumoniae]